MSQLKIWGGHCQFGGSLRGVYGLSPINCLRHYYTSLVIMMLKPLFHTHTQTNTYLHAHREREGGRVSLDVQYPKKLVLHCEDEFPHGVGRLQRSSWVKSHVGVLLCETKLYK